MFAYLRGSPYLWLGNSAIQYEAAYLTDLLIIPNNNYQFIINQCFTGPRCCRSHQSLYNSHNPLGYIAVS